MRHVMIDGSWHCQQCNTTIESPRYETEGIVSGHECPEDD
jgi:hypothetical protein